MRIFVTGGSGFIGRHLLPLLAHHDVLCLSRNAKTEDRAAGHRVLVGDLNSPQSYAGELERFGPECCIHLAWGGLPDYSFQNCRNNLSVSSILFEMLGQLGCRKVFVGGSCWEYGSNNGAMKEGFPGRDESLFAAHKTALRLIGQSHFAAVGGNLIWGRIFFVYGPGQRQTSLIPSCFESLARGKVPDIRNPLAINDFVHVSDVASAIGKLVEEENISGIFNIGSGRPVAVWEVVNQASAVMGLPAVYQDMPPSEKGIWADISRMNRLGWQPEVLLQDGISQAFEAFGAKQ